MDADVLIAGGGAAGLAAAGVLAHAGLRTVVIEAKARLGGRMSTVLDPRALAPIELGAEFVHGRPEVTLRRLALFGARAVEAGTEGWATNARGELERRGDDAFGEVAQLLASGHAGGPAGESVEDALSRAPRGKAELAGWARSFVAGFDAADPARASARAILDEWQSDASIEGSQSRPSGGYAAFVDHLVRALDPSRVKLHTRHVVRSIRSEATQVTAEVTRAYGVPIEIRAAHAIVTLPVGVLHRGQGEGSVVFDPPLSAAKREALSSLVMGPVRKIVMLFSHPFWESVAGGRYRDAAFFHQTPGSGRVAETPAFPTFWTQAPGRAPVVVAWAGGPAAEALADFEDDAVAQRAVREFGRVIGDEAACADAFLDAFTWNWQRDPYACGAYSYVAAGGESARARFAEAEGRLSFAGEATAGDGEGGTVAGALISGERAARELLTRKKEATS